MLGGQDPYAHNKIPKERLFTMETGPDGSIEAVEVFDFEQSNLSDRRVAILDAGDVVYIWVGSRSKRADKADMTAMCDNGEQAICISVSWSENVMIYQTK